MKGDEYIMSEEYVIMAIIATILIISGILMVSIMTAGFISKERISLITLLAGIPFIAIGTSFFTYKNIESSQVLHLVLITFGASLAVTFVGILMGIMFIKIDDIVDKTLDKYYRAH